MRYGLTLAALLSINLILRLINLKSLPLYLDEGIYIYWAHQFALDPSNAYLSLLDGKTPLFMWLVSWLNPIFRDYLFTARFISTVAGFVSLFAWSQILRLQFNHKCSLIFLCLITLTPYPFLLDRMAFVDSTMTAFASLGLLIIFISQKLFSTRYAACGLVLGVFSGLLLGFSYMTKTSAYMFVYLSLIILFLFLFHHFRDGHWKMFLLTLFSVIIVLFTYREVVSYIQVGGFRYWSGIVTKEHQLTYTVPEVIHNLRFDVGHYLINFRYLADYLSTYLGVLTLLSLLGLIIILKSSQQSIWLVLYSLLITAGIFLSAKVMASRYFYPIIYPLLGLSSIAASYLWSVSSPLLKNYYKVILVLLLIPVILLILSPLNALYASDDQSNFVTGQVSAIGLDQTMHFLSQNPSENIIGVTGIWGVREGVATLLEERGVQTLLINTWIERYSRDRLSQCPSDQKLIGEFCYKLTLDKLLKSPKPNKYLYLIPVNDVQSIENLQQLIPLQIISQFVRPGSDNFVYLLKII